MTFDGNPKPVQFIQPNVLYCPGLSIIENYGLADKLRSGLIERAKDC